MRSNRREYLTYVAALIVIAGCARKDDAATSDTTTVTGSAPGVAAAPAPSSTTRSPARDGDQEFLRHMVDHHEGLIQMATAAMTKATQSATQGDAHNLHTKQADEQKKMIADLQRTYGDSVTPMVMPQHKAMNDSLQALSGQEYDRAFYRNVVAHHREGIKMTDDMLPRLTKPEIRQMAEKMKADQQKEIAAFERKAK